MIRTFEMAVEIELRLVPDASAPAAARHAIEVNRGSLDEGSFRDATLLVSELATNSVRHAGLGPAEPIRLSARLSASRVRVEVADRGRGFGADGPAPADDHGWGLVLVERIANPLGHRPP